MLKRISLYTDGGARGNPGPAAAAFVAKNGNEIILKRSEYLGRTTNNQAEYRALVLGLEELLRMNVKKISCFLDSELVVKQLNGQYRVKDKDLRLPYEKILKLAGEFKEIKFSHIRREKNKEADKLVNEELDKHFRS